MYYLVWSNEHGLWWGPKERGYTRVMEQAGRYSYVEAKRICDKASVNGVLFSTVLTADGTLARSYPEVMMPAPTLQSCDVDVYAPAGEREVSP